jgi:hypothetical protein
MRRSDFSALAGHFSDSVFGVEIVLVRRAGLRDSDAAENQWRILLEFW